MKGSAPTEVILDFDPEQARYIRERRWHDTQTLANLPGRRLPPHHDRHRPRRSAPLGPLLRPARPRPRPALARASGAGGGSGVGEKSSGKLRQRGRKTAVPLINMSGSSRVRQALPLSLYTRKENQTNGAAKPLGRESPVLHSWPTTPKSRPALYPGTMPGTPPSCDYSRGRPY